MLVSRDTTKSNPPLLKTEKVDVPEFGDGAQMALRALTARQRWEFGKLARQAGDDESNEDRDPASYLITVSAIDEAGKLLYGAQDADWIADWPGDLVDRLSTAVMEMSGLSSDTGKGSKNGSKPSATTETESSPTDSPETSPGPSTK